MYIFLFPGVVIVIGGGGCCINGFAGGGSGLGKTKCCVYICYYNGACCYDGSAKENYH